LILTEGIGFIRK